MSEMIVGIDLGTCNSSAAVMKGGKPQLIAFSEPSRIEGKYVLPSYVAYDQKGDVAYIGGAARGQAPLNSKRTFYDIKRLIGKKYKDWIEEANALNLPYDIVEGEDRYVKLKLENKTLYPHEVTAEILRQIKKDAENNLNEVINRAVITVPAYFDDDKRKYTRKAGEDAKLEVVHVLVEPAAALLTYSEMVGMEKMYPYLFSISPEFKTDLENERLSPDLRNAFENNNYPLASNAIISKVSSTKWEISDEKRAYMIKELGAQLKIYKSNPTIMVFDIGAGTLDIVIMKYKEVMGEEIFLPVDGEEKGTIVYDEEEGESESKFEPLVYEGDNSLGGTNMDAEIMNYVLKEIQDEYSKDIKNDSGALMELKKKVETAKIRLAKKEDLIIDIDYGQDTFEVPLTRKKLEELVSPVIDRCREVIGRALKDLKEKANLEKEGIDDVILVGGPTRMPIIQTMIEEEVGKPLRNIDINAWDPMACVATGAAHWVGISIDEIISDKWEKGVYIDEGTPYAYGIIKNKDTDSIFFKVIEKGTIYPTQGQYSIQLGLMEEKAKIVVGQINPADLADYINLGEYEFRIVASPKPREIDVIFDLDHDGILSVTMTDKEVNESLRLVGLEADKEEIDGRKRPVTEVLTMEEEKAKDTEIQKKEEERGKKESDEAIEELLRLGIPREKIAESAMLNKVDRRWKTAFSLYRRISEYRMPPMVKRNIDQKVQKLNDELNKESDSPQQHAINVFDLAEELIKACENAPIEITEDVLQGAIIKANKLIEDIEKLPGIPTDISEKISELENVIDNPDLPKNKQYTGIEARIEEIKFLLEKHKINI